MKIRSIKILLLAALALTSGSVMAIDLAGSGTTLAMLHKIQGQWRTPCKSVGGGEGLYHITKLSVSYTGFSFARTEYQNARCVRVRRSRVREYGFALRGMQTLKGGAEVFAIDFRGESDVAGELYPLNIIQFEDGKLFLGDDVGQASKGRLQQLNRRSVYIR